MLPILFGMFVLAAAVRAQEVTASIVGLVVDSSGSAMAGATVNLQSISTNITSVNYGQVTSARDARRVQLGLKLNF